jgi:predicted transcriptional regulator
VRLTPEFPEYSVAVLQDVPRLVRGMAIGGIKSSVPQNQRERILLVFQGEKDLKVAAGFDRPDDAYLVLLDREGSIRWRFHGAFTEDSLQELRSQAATLTKKP